MNELMNKNDTEKTRNILGRLSLSFVAWRM